MDAQVIALKLFLDELGVPDDIDTLDDRKRVQKAVYLGQRSGVDLGYRFGWYLMGPYSPSLTQDYYRLNDARILGKRDWEGKTLRESVRERLGRIQPILRVPDALSLSQEQWLELLASYDYLRKVSAYDRDQAIEILKREKRHLLPYVEAAEQQLEAAGLSADWAVSDNC